MKRFGISVICLLTAVAFAACSTTEERTPTNTTAPVVNSSPLPASAYKAAITMVTPAPQTLKAGESVPLQVKVKNMGNMAWPAQTPDGRYKVTLGNHWLDKKGKEVIVDDGRADLPHDLKPGEEVELTLKVTAPKPAGSYILELDMVHEGLTWFTAHGSQIVKTNITIQ
jgi:hypothetical protein